MNATIGNFRGEQLAGVDACTGCGTCHGMCPVRAINLAVDASRGVYCPRIDHDLCSECGICTRVCPVLSLDVRSIASSIPDSGRKDTVIGNYEKAYFAHAIDYDIRYRAASGGLVTALLILALEEGLIDGVLVTRMNPNDSLLPESFIARTKDDIKNASGSRYCPVPANSAIRTLLETDGRFAVVGLPCHLHGVRMAELVSEELRKKIVLHIGLFCSHTLNFHGTRHLLRRIGVNSSDVTSIDYRGRGWPGGITVQDKGGNSRFIPNRAPLWGAIFGSHFYTPTSCLWCNDLTSELADLSFGDPWLPDIVRNETVGKSIVVSRTATGESLMQMALDHQRIESQLIDTRTVVASQVLFSYFKKGCIRMRYEFGGTDRTPVLEVAGESSGTTDKLLALAAIINSSMGHSRLFRYVLERIPLQLLWWYSALINRILARNSHRWIQQLGGQSDK